MAYNSNISDQSQVRHAQTQHDAEPLSDPSPGAKQGSSSYVKTATVKDASFYKAQAYTEVMSEMQSNTGWSEQKITMVLQNNARLKAKFQQDVQERAEKMQSKNEREVKVTQRRILYAASKQEACVFTAKTSETGKTTAAAKPFFEAKGGSEEAVKGGAVKEDVSQDTTLVMDKAAVPPPIVARPSTDHRAVQSPVSQATQTTQPPQAAPPPQFNDLSAYCTKLNPDDVITRDPHTGNFKVIDKITQNGTEQTAARDIIKALDSAAKDAKTSRKDISSMCKTLMGNKAFQKELVSDTELHLQFTSITDGCSKKAKKQLTKLGKDKLDFIRNGIIQTCQAARHAVEQSSAIITKHLNAFQTLAKMSGMKQKEVDVAGQKVKLKNLAVACARELDRNATLLKEYGSAPNAAMKMVTTALVRAGQTVSEMSVMRSANKPANNGDTFQTFVKNIDRMLDGFCRTHFVEVGRTETEAGGSFDTLELARNAKLETQLGQFPELKDLVKDRLELNSLIHDAREGQILNAEKLAVITAKTEAFIDKYAALTDRFKHEMATIRKDTMPPFDQFGVEDGVRTSTDSKKLLEDLLGKYPNCQKMIAVYCDPNETDKKKIKKASDFLKRELENQFKLSAKIKHYQKDI